MAEKATKSVLHPPAASGRPGRPLLVGPEAGLLAVLEAYERLAYAGADRTWTEFSDTFDWTSPVERTLPRARCRRCPAGRPAVRGRLDGVRAVGGGALERAAAALADASGDGPRPHAVRRPRRDPVALRFERPVGAGAHDRDP